MELDSAKIQRMVNDTYKVGILDLLSYGPQSNAVMIEHLLGGLTKGEFLFKDSMPFTPALAELVSDGTVIAYSLAVGDDAVSFALTEDVDPDVVHFMPLPDGMAEMGKDITNTHYWRASLRTLDPDDTENYLPVPRGDSPSSVSDIMARIMDGGVDPEVDHHQDGGDNE